MRLPWILVSWIVASLLLVSASAAVARVDLGPAFSSDLMVKFPTPPAVSDGERYVAFVPGSGTVRVLDTRTGRSRDLLAACFPVAAGASHILLSCGGRYEVLDAVTLATRRLRIIADSAYTAIGRYWVATTCSAFCPSQPVGPGYRVPETYLNWHTDRTRTVYYNADLNSPRLAPEPPLPSVLRVSSTGFDEGIFTPLEVRDPRGRITRLSACRPDCETVDASAGKVTWLQFPDDNGVLYGYDIARRRRYWWPPHFPPSLQTTNADLEDVVHTRYEALVSTLQSEFGNRDLARYGLVAYRWK